MKTTLIAALVALGVTSSAAYAEDYLAKNGFKRTDLTEAQVQALRKRGFPEHKFVPIRRPQDNGGPASQWVYFDPLACKCLQAGNSNKVAGYKERSWGDNVANWEYMHGNAMDNSLLNEVGVGDTLWDTN